MNRCFITIAFLVLSTSLVKADNVNNKNTNTKNNINKTSNINNKTAKASNQYTNSKKYNADPTPEAKMKPDYGDLVKKLPDRVNESPDFMKEGQYSIKKSENLFKYSNIYISLGLGQEFLYAMTVNNKLTNNNNIPGYTIKNGKFMPTRGFDIAPLVFDFSVGYRPFEKEILNGLRFELNASYNIKNEYRLIDYDRLFKGSGDVDHAAYKSELNKTSYSIGLLSFYDFYFLSGEQNIIVPYVGLGVHTTFGKLDMTSFFLDRKNGKSKFSEEHLSINNNSVDLSQHIGVNLFKGYIFADYSFNTHINAQVATSSLIKVGLRIPLVGV